MKKWSSLFFLLASLLCSAMCAVVAYEFCEIKWEIKTCYTSAPVDIAFLYAIPFAVGIIACLAAAFCLRKRGK